MRISGDLDSSLKEALCSRDLLAGQKSISFYLISGVDYNDTR